MGISLVLLEIVNYRTIFRQTSLEIYGIVVGIIFLLLGVWIGYQFVMRPGKTSSYTGKIKEELSRRENEVLLAMAEGLSNKEIADKLFVSENTIKTHVSNIFVKLNVQRRTQAILKAKELFIQSNTKEWSS